MVRLRVIRWSQRVREQADQLEKSWSHKACPAQLALDSVLVGRLTLFS